MVCLTNTEDNDRNRKHIANELLEYFKNNNRRRDLTQDLIDFTEKVAYHMLACNNGFTPNLDPFGKKSILFELLLEKYKSYAKATLAKSYIYTPQYAEEHGSWVDLYDEKGNPIPEPILTDPIIDSISKYVVNLLGENILEFELILIDSAYTGILKSDRLLNLMGSPSVDIKNRIWKILNDSLEDKIKNERLSDSNLSIYEARKIVYERTMTELHNEITESFATEWYGKDYKNNSKYYDSSTGKFLNPIKEEGATKDMWLIRANILNSLKDRMKDPYATKAIVNLLANYMTNMDVNRMSSKLLSDSLELMLGTDIVTDIYKNVGLLGRNAKNNITKKDVNKARLKLIEEFEKHTHNVLENNAALKKIHEAIRAITYFWYAALRGVANLFQFFHNIPQSVAAGLGVFMLTPNLALSLGAAITVGITAYGVNYYINGKYEDSTVNYLKHQLLLRDLAIYTSLCDHVSDKADFVLLSHNDKFVEDDEKIKAKMLEKLSSSVTNLLYDLLKTYNKMIMSARHNKDNVLEQDYLLAFRLLKTALFSNYVNTNDHIQQALYHIIRTCTTQINDKLEYLNNITDDLEKLTDKESKEFILSWDVENLMRISKDVLSPFTYIFFGNNKDSDFVLSELIKKSPIFKISDDQNKQNILDLIKDQIADNLSKLNNLYERIIGLYCDTWSDDYIDKTVGISITGKALDTIKAMSRYWINNLVHGGSTLGFIGTNIMPARASFSTIVKMVHQKLMEIDTLTSKEINYFSDKLELARVDSRSPKFPVWDRLKFTNQVNKYCETISTGEYTGYLVSDTNMGQYYYDFHLEVNAILKRRNIQKDAFGNLVFKDELLWIDYQQDLILWMAGFDYDARIEKYVIRDKDGDMYTYLYLYSNHESASDYGILPRVHRRYTYEYYMNKTAILGRAGTEKLSYINRSIAEIYKKATDTVTIDGVEKQFVNIAKLTDFQRKQLKQFLIDKSNLSTRYDIILSPDGEKIAKFIPKSEEDIELSKKFVKWNQYVYISNFINPRDVDLYYGVDTKHMTEEEKTALLLKKDEIFKKAVARLTDKTLVKAVLAKYKDKIELLLEIYDNNKTNINKSKLDQIVAERDLFKKLSVTKKFANFLYDNIKSTQNQVLDTDDDDIVTYLLLKATLNMINKFVLVESFNGTVVKDLRKLGVSMEKEREQYRENIRIISLIEKSIERIKNTIEDEDVLIPQRVESNPNKYKYEEIFVQGIVKVLDDNNKVGDQQFFLYLQKKGIFTKSEANNLKIEKGQRYYVPSIFNNLEINLKVTPNVEKYKRLFELRGKGEEGWHEAGSWYENVPINLYLTYKSELQDPKYEEDAEKYIQVNKERKEYDNSDKYDEVKNDKFYTTALDILDAAWKNYEGFSRTSKYQLPQVEAEMSQLVARGLTNSVLHPLTGMATVAKGIKHGYNSMFYTTSRDIEYSSEDIEYADGTQVKVIPSRYTTPLKDGNTIETDLVKSISAFYTESVRYKYRKLYEPLMHVLYSRMALPKNKTDLLDKIADEINHFLYGLNITGSGRNGTMTKHDEYLAKISSMFREAVHRKLMAHNLPSVFKNLADSFISFLSNVYTAKHISARNVLNALRRMTIWNKADTKILPPILSQVLCSFNRSKALNYTQAAMNMFELNTTTSRRLSDQNKYAIRRFWDRLDEIEYSLGDYTFRAIITESVFDAYRLILSPIDNKYHFMNSEQARYAYATAANKEGFGKLDPIWMEKGYKAWVSSNVNYRDLYYFDKHTGTLVMKKLVELKVSEVDESGKKKKTKVQIETAGLDTPELHTLIRSEIIQLSNNVNGMLHSSDRTKVERNIYGMFALSFRGWMVTHWAEYNRDGIDFYEQYETGNSTNTELLKDWFLGDLLSDKGRHRTEMALFNGDTNFEGGYNFATGTIDKGLFKFSMSQYIKNIPNIIGYMLILPSYIPGMMTKGDMLKRGYDINTITQLRWAAASINFMMLTLALTCYAKALLFGADGDDPDKWKKALAYNVAVASITERFSTLGTIPFMSGVTDLLKSVTVATSYFDDLKYVFALLNDLTVLGQSEINEIIDEDDEELNMMNTYLKSDLITGSYQGFNRIQRDFAKTISLLPFDKLKFLTIMQGFNQTGTINNNVTDFFGVPNDFIWNPKDGMVSDLLGLPEDTNFMNLDAGWYRSTNTNPLKQRTKYSLNIIPNAFIKNYDFIYSPSTEDFFGPWDFNRIDRDPKINAVSHAVGSAKSVFSGSHGSSRGSGRSGGRSSSSRSSGRR